VTILVMATSNPGKLREMQALLGQSDWQLHLKPDAIEVEENGTTFAENAALKATQVAQATGQWAIADDSGLAVDALGGEPGVYSARYGANDRDRIDRLLKELGPQPNRSAQFVCVVVLANPKGDIVLQAEGICPGEIVPEPRGEKGFGYDPIFYVPEAKLTFAEMSASVKQQVSHRGRAFQKLLPELEAIHQSLI
jgi:XTP/dITP diphosphohydrolase